MSENSNTPYQTIEIGPGAWRIEEDVVRFFLFEGSEKSLLVDTGFGGGDPLALAQALTDKPIILVNTHTDGDHIGGNSHFTEVYMHPAEFANYEKTLTTPRPLPLWECDTIDLGGRSFEVLLIPGHTPGSIALLDRENRILVVGDSVSDRPVFIFGDHRSLPAIIASLEKLESKMDSFDTIYTSHGSFPLTTDAIAAQLDTAKRLLAGELDDLDPPFELPARMYVWESASFFM